MGKRLVVVSGIRATGRLHLGNYFGAMVNFAPLQETHDCFFFVADYHTLTTNPKPEEIKKHLPEIVLSYLALGLDPNKCTIFAQSSVPEITELALLLSMVQPLGELLRCPTFKEKARKQPNNINAGLVCYPVLMAADILIQKASLVPVGKDQLSHIILAQNMADRFNRLFGNTFPRPSVLKEKAVKVPGLFGGKMGKSEGEASAIYLTDSQETVAKKIATAKTDTNRKYLKDPGNPFKCPMYEIHKRVSSFSERRAIRSGCKSAQIGCVECKRLLSRNIAGALEPFQGRRRQLAEKPDYVAMVLRDGGEKARQTARATLEEAREKIGIQRF